MNILQEAAVLVHGNRQKQYGHPADDYTALALIWRGVLLQAGITTPEQSEKLTAEVAALLMAALKVNRLAKDATHKDSLVDLAGYARVIEMILKRTRL